MENDVFWSEMLTLKKTGGMGRENRRERLWDYFGGEGTERNSSLYKRVVTWVERMAASAYGIIGGGGGDTERNAEGNAECNGDDKVLFTVKPNVVFS